jgi:RNA polymerase sigma-70 factor (ECF subfamily)
MNRTCREECAPHPVDDERMRALYEAHGPALLRTISGWIRGDRGTAEDLLQETMLRAWRNLHTLDERPIRPWLLTVARRLAIDASRSRAARPPECGDAPLERIAAGRDEVGRVLDRAVLAPALSGLPGPQRTVLFHVYYLHATMRQTAETLGIPEGTVKTRTRNALKTLRSGLADPPECVR